jgi:hypothetical protein
MTFDDPADRNVSELVRTLPPHDVSARRAARLRAQCHLQLARQAHETVTPRSWVPAGLAAAGVLYAIAIVVRALAPPG